MRFPVSCPRCGLSLQAEYRDSGIYELSCSRCGLQFTLYLRKHRFELLFDLGTRALQDGYTREAVSSFAASLERFFEFYARASLLRAAADRAEGFERAQARLEQTWELLSAQSERQLGAFAALYLSQGKVPDFLTPQHLGSDFRNRVIHRGYLPARAEVDAYAARIFALIDRLLTELGEADAHAELEQEYLYSRHLAAQLDGAVAVFAEHLGMFRVWRFGKQLLRKRQPPQKIALSPDNDARTFQAALRNRGELLGEVFKAISPALRQPAGREERQAEKGL